MLPQYQNCKFKKLIILFTVILSMSLYLVSFTSSRWPLVNNVAEAKVYNSISEAQDNTKFIPLVSNVIEGKVHNSISQDRNNTKVIPVVNNVTEVNNDTGAKVYNSISENRINTKVIPLVNNVTESNVNNSIAEDRNNTKVIPVVNNVTEGKVYNSISKDRNNTKFILYWAPLWKTWDYGYGYEPFKNCEYSNCFTTNNRSLLNLEKFDALLFHADYNKTQHGVPWIRLPHQVYILANFEAPINICPDLKQYQSYFNWTMSYRLDTDIVRPYGYIIKQTTNYTQPSTAVLKNKTELAAWMVSHCHTSSKREELGKEIQKRAKIDVYGKCGTLQCRRNCYTIIQQKYKFYFSFENSYCKEYATEKLYNILQTDVVPVVYGFGDYKIIAPPNSVINVEDFESAEDLVNYLKYLNKNDEEYLKYFEWKRDYLVSSSMEPSACQICKKLHELNESIYDDLYTWWRGKDYSMCKSGKSLPKIIVNSFH